MRYALSLLVLVGSLAHAELPAPGTPGAPDDPRYCGEPMREALKPGQTTKPRIIRSRSVLNKFVQVFPCPTTLQSTTSCPNAAINHSIPLSRGGCDSQINLTWLPDALKSCAGRICVDRWELKYHGFPRQIVDFSPDDEAEEFVFDKPE